mgnify:FL=1
MTNHYVDNKKFFQEMTDWKKRVRDAEESDDPTPQVTEYIGECFLLIAERLATRPNFVNYPYKEEMIGDAIENCLIAANNFDPDKSSNPFAYFTQITYFAFLRRIQREKKQDTIKYKMMEAADAKGELAFEVDPDGNSTDPYADYLKLNPSDVVKTETTKKKKTRKKKNNTEELF